MFFTIEIKIVVNKENGQLMKYLSNFGTGWGFIPDGDSISFIDNHGKLCFIINMEIALY